MSLDRTRKISVEAVLLSTVEAKGDLLVGTAAGAVARKVVGANGRALLADSSQGGGIDWVPLGQKASDFTVSLINVDASWAAGYSHLELVYVSVGGGSLRSLGVPSAGAGTVLVLRSGATAVWSVRHQVAGGSGAKFYLASLADVNMRVNDVMTLVYDGTNWVEVSQVSDPPGTEYAYVEFTAGVTVTATAEATPNDVVSAGTITFPSNSRLIIEFFTPAILTPNAVDSAYVLLNLWDDTTNLGRICYTRLAGDNTTPDRSIELPCYGRRILSPSNASHTYKVRAWVSPSGAGTVDAGVGGAGAQLPGYIRITKA